jgi:hypothetical protein
MQFFLERKQKQNKTKNKNKENKVFPPPHLKYALSSMKETNIK